MFHFIENKLGDILYPLSVKVGNNKTVAAISEGFLRATILTLGVAVFAIIGNFPIPAWMEFLKESGLDLHFVALQNASMNILGLYISFTIAYSYAKQCKQEPLTAGLLSLGSFLALSIQTVEGAGGTVAAFAIANLGADAMFGALIVALLTSRLYVFLKKKNLVLKMPETVPPAVTESLSPVFIAMILFAFVFFIRVGFSLTPYGNFMTFVTQAIGAPFLKIGLSIPSVIFISMLGNFVWFFGIHSNAVQAPFVPVLMTAIIANVTAYQSGEALPYLATMVVYSCISTGGGLKFALNCAMIGAKSERYRSLQKVAFVPGLFNINEPTLFGFPMILNPYMFIPLVTTPLVIGIFASVVLSIFPFSINPTSMLLPWSTPFFLKAFIGGGLYYVLLHLACLLIATLIYYPFFVLADRQSIKEEKALELSNNLE